ncbi:carnosine N-methyltransferase [Malassezia brasiliensis]|uniref:carnosine N-methyltransferase n=1 Tax=Malassezia brasiliensis TaxID=1821822 RepID=A0AAF0DV66_9BASI|nr:carnosine N-methyltransferase [Malassezia brasiliensis]
MGDAVQSAEERAHFAQVLRAWDEYLPYALSVNQARRKALCNLPLAHQTMLRALSTPLPAPTLGEPVPDTKGGVRARLAEMDDRIRRNADVLAQVADFCRDFLGILDADDVEETDDAEANDVEVDDGEVDDAHAVDTNEDTHTNHTVSEGDQDRIRTALRQMVRDWSAEGREERDAAYAPILTALVQRIPPNRTVRVLVPGAGLGRLAFDLAAQGYSVQGNEFSYFMLIPSHFLLNNTQRVRQHVVYPYIHSVSNWVTAADLLRGVAIPDVLPSSLAPGTDFSMVAGEFVEVYAKPEERNAWNCVATCYFLDTAKNALRYIEVINALLPVGGLWINVGPLLWHFEHDAHTPSLELTLDEILALLPQLGFVVEELHMLPAQSYTGSAHSMLAHQYRPVFWVCRKVEEHAMAPAV